MKIIHRVIPHHYLLLALSAVWLGACNRSAPESNLSATAQSIRVHSWGEYLVPEVVEAFTEQTGIQVEITAYENTDFLVESLRTDPGAYDVVITDDGTTKRLMSMRLLHRLSETQIPNITHLDRDQLNLDSDPNNEFAVPYLWGTTVIAFRKDRLSNPARSWRTLLSETAEYPVSIIHERMECFEHTFRLLGLPPDSNDSQHFEKATHVLSNLARQSRVHFTTDTGAKDDLISGESHVAMLYSGDAELLSNNDPNIDFFIPDEGSSLWVDYFTVPRESDHADLAQQFINHMQEPKAAARSSNALRFATANKDALPFIGKALLDDKRIYPNAEVRAKCEFVTEEGRVEMSKQYWWKVKDSIHGGTVAIDSDEG